MKIAVIGYGSIGKRHVANLLAMGEQNLLVCDTNANADVHVHAPFEFRTDLRDMWPWKPEVVLICTPSDSHVGLTNDAICNGAHCFVEKPLAMNEEDARYLLYQAKRKNVQLAVGYQLPFNPIRFPRWILTETLRLVHAQDMSQWPSQYQKDVLGEFSHELHLACYVHGPVKELVAYEREQGLLWQIELQHLHAHSSIHLFAGHAPYLRTAHLDGHTAWYFNKEQNDQAYKDELAAFLKACRGEGWDERLCSGAEAAHVVRIVEACKESVNECKVVTL